MFYSLIFIYILCFFYLFGTYFFFFSEIFIFVVFDIIYLTGPELNLMRNFTLNLLTGLSEKCQFFNDFPVKIFLYSCIAVFLFLLFLLVVSSITFLIVPVAFFSLLFYSFALSCSVLHSVLYFF